jgi:hypothetical protein
MGFILSVRRLGNTVAVMALLSYSTAGWDRCGQSASHCGDAGSNPHQVVWDLWWIKWHRGGLTPSTSVSSASFNFPNCSIFIYCFSSMLHTLDNDNVWGELVACFPLIRHGPHRKRHNQSLFLFLGSFLTELLLIIHTGRSPLWSTGQSCWLQNQRSAFDSRRCQIFWEVVGLERGPLSLVSTIEELLERKSRGSGLESREYGRRDSSRWPLGALCPQKLALTLPTSCGRSVGIVRSWTEATEFIFPLQGSTDTLVQKFSRYVCTL